MKQIKLTLSDVNSKWIKRFCHELDCSYDMLMTEFICTYLNSEHYKTFLETENNKELKYSDLEG